MQACHTLRHLLGQNHSICCKVISLDSWGGIRTEVLYQYQYTVHTNRNDLQSETSDAEDLMFRLHGSSLSLGTELSQIVGSVSSGLGHVLRTHSVM